MFKGNNIENSPKSVNREDISQKEQNNIEELKNNQNVNKVEEVKEENKENKENEENEEKKEDKYFLDVNEIENSLDEEKVKDNNNKLNEDLDEIERKKQEEKEGLEKIKNEKEKEEKEKAEIYKQKKLKEKERQKKIKEKERQKKLEEEERQRKLEEEKRKEEELRKKKEKEEEKLEAQKNKEEEEEEEKEEEKKSIKAKEDSKEVEVLIYEKVENENELNESKDSSESLTNKTKEVKQEKKEEKKQFNNFAGRPVTTPICDDNNTTTKNKNKVKSEQNDSIEELKIEDFTEQDYNTPKKEEDKNEETKNSKNNNPKKNIDKTKKIQNSKGKNNKLIGFNSEKGNEETEKNKDKNETNSSFVSKSEEEEKTLKEKNSQIENIKKKLSPEEIDEIEQVKAIIDEFDVSHPDLSDLNTYTHITSFDKREEFLSEKIKDYKEKILNPEERINAEERRKSFLKKSSYRSQIMENELILQFNEKCIESHKERLERLITERSDFLDKIEDIDESDLFNSDKDNERLKIGNLGNLKTFVYKYSLHDNWRVMSTFVKNFKYWRNCLPDGNSFYRTLMFGFLEDYILKGRTDDLKSILCELTWEEFENLLKTKRVNTKKIYAIFKLIINKVEKEEIEEAYDIFIKAYNCESTDFDIAMVIYLRKIIFDYMKEIHGLIMKYEQENENKIDKRKLVNYIALEELGIEPEFSILNAIPQLFDVNLQIMWIDGTFLKEAEGLIRFASEDSLTEFPNVAIGWFYGSYHILYTKIKTNAIFDKIAGKEDINIKQLTFEGEETSDCEICGKNTQSIIFLEKKFIACFPCLKSHLLKIMQKRAKMFSKNGFIGLEFYTRDIHIQDNFYVNDYEFIEIFEDFNMINCLHDSKISTCFLCNKKKSKKSLATLNCLCRYCNDCLNIKYEKATKGYKILNDYEKKIWKEEICACNNPFDVNDAQRFIKGITQEDQAEANERLKYYIRIYCMKCENQIFVKEEKTQQYIQRIKYTKVFLKVDKGENGKKDSGEPHNICNDCIKVSKKGGEIKNEIFCHICNIRHELVIEERESCCAGCNIV